MVARSAMREHSNNNHFSNHARSDTPFRGTVPTPPAPKDIFEIVVAHYNEDLSWLEHFRAEATVYSKGSPPEGGPFRDVIHLPNIGRETHTILWHIVNRYETLASITMFIQGDVQNSKGVRPHTDLLAAQMRDKAFQTAFGQASTFGSAGNLKTFDMWDGIDWVNDAENAHWLAKSGTEMKMASITPRVFWQRNFGHDPPASIVYAEASLLAVSADTVRLRPLSFYQTLLGYLVDDDHVNPEFGHYLERFWGEIFSLKSIEIRENSEAIPA